MINIINVNKYYISKNQKILALKDINLAIPKACIFGIVGESGAGKTSLLRSINMLEKPSEGRVIVDGYDLTSLNNEDLLNARRNIGMIFQHFNLLSQETVFDNISLPLRLKKINKSKLDNIILPLLETVGLKDKIYAYPKELSGGQKQRVAIARALATNPKVLLCDEATSALDQKNTESILDLLAEINEKTKVTIVLITHELDVIKSICHEVALMSQGQIIESGSVEKFFAYPETKIAKDMVEKSLKMHLPLALKREISSVPSITHLYPLIKIIFRGNLVKEAIISEASRKFMIDISIIQSNIEFIGKSVVGFLTAELRGDKKAIDDVLPYFVDKNLDIEVVGYVA